MFGLLDERILQQWHMSLLRRLHWIQLQVQNLRSSKKEEHSSKYFQILDLIVYPFFSFSATLREWIAR